MAKKTKTNNLQEQADFCKSLADPKRLLIIHKLSDGEKSVNTIADLVGMKQSNTSQHLAVLKKAGVIAPRRQGNMVFYRLDNERIAGDCDKLRNFIVKYF